MAEKMGNEASSSGGSIHRGESVVIDHGCRLSSCGYCKSGGFTSCSHGLWAQSITVDDYQELLDRGWRRSGSFLYKPEMERTCCPSYTIRLKAGDFVRNKEQNRVYRRMQRFLDGTLNVKKPDKVEDTPNSSQALCSLVGNASSSTMVSESIAKESFAGGCGDNHKAEEYIKYLSSKIDNAVRTCVERGKIPSVQLPKAIVKKVTQQAKKKLIEVCGDLLYTSNISFQIAAVLRRSQSAETDANQLGLSKSSITQSGQLFEVSPKLVAEMLACSLDQQGELSSLSIKACNGHLNFYSSTPETASRETSVNFVSPAQSSGGSGGKTKCSVLVNNHEFSQHKRRRLEIRLKRSTFDPEEYALYRRYQIRVHNDKPDKVTESSYKRFLVDTPIIFVPPSGDGTVPPCGFGSFHQQYVIDGQLVAVGVVDILPRCLSSKYLFWDPDLAFLSLGKYSALEEIKWVKETQVHCPSLQYYYLGYYIHSCCKMRYKAAYRPSELLCPLRYQWVPFDTVKPLLDKKSYVVLSDFAKLENGASSQLQAAENSIEQACIEPCQEDHIVSHSDEESLSEEDEEMNLDSEVNFGPETSSMEVEYELKADDISDIVLDLNGVRLQYKDLQRAFRPIREQRHKDLLELQLHRYTRAVGAGLSRRMVYSL
ncbi:arginyl-tRNA--protein transferase 2-like [Magnolia sinica]|uniref:arginyl-tRNA--protein transferase 2-like n=1 Tax=Magnolia sinica TaxID=86752 RepID=UPI002657F4BD|nr:arginyl-tRNA--protein transferase 2-like [Magnolia sinica]XP_058080138.1 arginyl-tRNA--protein transferase 2-like [Magnolia sinica]XP_058080139.1 arginyl-tRNA--protein transferase 2-like [Magnolia sinica]XP_058080140.1 arginyl-tRNA--protein transferase 2-like [Magnolia sinica]